MVTVYLGLVLLAGHAPKRSGVEALKMPACCHQPVWMPTCWEGTLQEADLKRLHEGALKSDPFISKAIGPKAKIERMRAAALRLGSQGVPQSYDDHLIIVGDAAGHIDPLTGEGIHTAIMVGRPPVLRHLLSRHV